MCSVAYMDRVWLAAWPQSRAPSGVACPWFLSPDFVSQPSGRQVEPSIYLSIYTEQLGVSPCHTQATAPPLDADAYLPERITNCRV